jgi:peptidylprolyl isomerase
LLAGCAAHDHAAHHSQHGQPAHQHGEQPPTPRLSEILDGSPAADWRRLDPQDTLYMEIPSGRVILELAPEFAPRHVANIRTLVRAGYFDGLAILRSQDNYVVQWGDPDDKRDLGVALKSVEPEFTRASTGLAFTTLPDPDTYAPEAGFAGGFWRARSPGE